jgi:hypothetical protein
LRSFPPDPPNRASRGNIGILTRRTYVGEPQFNKRSKSKELVSRSLSDGTGTVTISLARFGKSGRLLVPEWPEELLATAAVLDRRADIAA